MKEKDIEAIIFDMDGVMFDTERLYEEAFAMIAKKWGYESEVTEEFIKSFKGKKKEAIKLMYKELLDNLSIERTGKEFDADEHMKQVLDYLDNYIESKGMPIKNGKPAPDIYLKVCEEISVNPENAIVCEDAPNGIVAAYRAGTKPIMIIDRIEPTNEVMQLLFVKPLNTLIQVQEIISNKK